ncbi:hypothetical protein KFE25_005453 [Diacronema lutheri]|uniref:Uncharacterized protein n=1 Tax=Diacronema lutheri TaxID=2081491 RepID=A0A8J5XJL3_DIALT|nr:hypothetical protein KFE25_005453 [Diacronema lutheri]
MSVAATRSLALAKAAALAVVRAHGHASAAAAEAADDRAAVARAAAAAQAFGPPDADGASSVDEEDASSDDGGQAARASQGVPRSCEGVGLLAEQIGALDVRRQAVAQVDDDAVRVHAAASSGSPGRGRAATAAF